VNSPENNLPLLAPQTTGAGWQPDWIDPKVVIVLVHYSDVEQTLACIASLARLRYPTQEVLVVDNSGGQLLAEPLRKHFPFVTRIVAATNGGYTGGNNLGIAAALQRRADFVHILNPDTLVQNPHYLTELVRFMEKSPSVGLAGPRVHWHDPGTVQNTILRFPWLWRRIASWLLYRLGLARRATAREPREADALNGVCVLFRASALRDVGLFDEATFAYIEDIDWCYRAESKGWRRVHVPVDSVIHLQKTMGYELGSKVDFLLKRNTLYFLLKTDHPIQAACYTIATLVLGSVRVSIAALRNRRGTSMVRWLRGLAATYLQLWTGRVDQAMGPPRTFDEGSLAV
jgi:GT2 family glycosyltransferase